jgi:RND family efflux transporter MFP subunit
LKRILIVVIPLAVLGALVAYRVNLNRLDAARQQSVRSARRGAATVVEVAPAVVRDIVSAISAVGTVEAPDTVRIAPKLTGRIEYLEVHEGDPVTAGQVVVRLNAAALSADLQRQRAAAAASRSRLEQARITESSASVAVQTSIRQQEAVAASADADLKQVTQNYTAQQAAARASVDDAEGKIGAATAAVANGDAAVRSAQANLANAKARFARISGLHGRGFASAQDVDDARTSVTVQEAALDVARGQQTSARAQLDSANAQKRSAEQQLSIVKTKGEADIEAAQAKAKQAQAALDYAKANAVQTPAYRQYVAALKAAADADRAAARSAEAALAESVLTSPASGFVTSRTMDPGAVAATGQTILIIQAIRQVWVNVPVAEEDRHLVRQGMPATIEFDALPGKRPVGLVTQVNAAADAQSRQFAVRVTLANEDGAIKPGMFARARIETGRRRGTVVPREAVTGAPGGTTEVVVAGPDDKAQRRTVTTGPSDDSGTMVLTGVAPGERVVIMSASPVKDGAELRIGGRLGRRRPRGAAR